MATVLLLAGCSMGSHSDLHSKWGWKPEDYFKDPQLVALCSAIEANDLDEIDRLVKAGADVNAVGKAKMTPLLWAFPDNALYRLVGRPETDEKELALFERLLEHGADPNVVLENKITPRGGGNLGGLLNSGGYLPLNTSVTFLATRTRSPGYFQAVMRHGGDPNLRGGIGNLPMLHVLIGESFSGSAEKKERLQLLIDKGADLDALGGGDPATMRAARHSQYWIVLMLLDAGADPGKYEESCLSQLIHSVVRQDDDARKLGGEYLADYRKLVEQLENLGYSVEEAREDLERRREWRYYKPQEVKEAREKLVAERLARETAQALKNPGDLRAVPRMIEFLRWQIENKPKPAPDPGPTIEVLEKLTGEDFGRDPDKWRRWWLDVGKKKADGEKPM